MRHALCAMRFAGFREWGVKKVVAKIKSLVFTEVKPGFFIQIRSKVWKKRGNRWP